MELGLSSGLSGCLSPFSQGRTQRFSFADDYFSTLDVYVLLRQTPTIWNKPGSESPLGAVRQGGATELIGTGTLSPGRGRIRHWYWESSRVIARMQVAPRSPASLRWHEEDSRTQSHSQPTRSYWSQQLDVIPTGDTWAIPSLQPLPDVSQAASVLTALGDHTSH